MVWQFLWVQTALLILKNNKKLRHSENENFEGGSFTLKRANIHY